MTDTNDIAVLRDLAQQYMQIATSPGMAQRRQLWKDHLSLRPTSPPIVLRFGMWNMWCREVFADSNMLCKDAFYRDWERELRVMLFQAATGDDYVLEPWLVMRSVQARRGPGLWGLQAEHTHSDTEGGSWKFDSPIKEWSDLAKISPPPHVIDEEETRRQANRLGEAIGAILPIDIERGPVATSFHSDISYWLAQLRGLEQMMIDMYESPRELHGLLAFLRDGILANQAAAEKAGDYSATSGQNQCCCYADQTLPPAPMQYGVKRKQLWGFMAAQEFTLISPAMHDEFLLQYQLPILKHFGLVAYGCCEDLTEKITMLRQIPNLRIIAVTPRANVQRCAEQIQADYVSSWRPNPTDMVSTHFDEARVRRIIGEGLKAFRGGRMHINLKDVETVQGQPERLARWVQIVREEIAKA